MTPEFEKYLEDRESFFANKITETLYQNKGKELEPLEKSKLDIIHAYVKEITTLHRMRSEIRHKELLEIPLNLSTDGSGLSTLKFTSNAQIT